MHASLWCCSGGAEGRPQIWVGDASPGDGAALMCGPAGFMLQTLPALHARVRDLQPVIGQGFAPENFVPPCWNMTCWLEQPYVCRHNSSFANFLLLVSSSAVCVTNTAAATPHRIEQFCRDSGLGCMSGYPTAYVCLLRQQDGSKQVLRHHMVTVLRYSGRHGISCLSKQRPSESNLCPPPPPECHSKQALHVQCTCPEPPFAFVSSTRADGHCLLCAMHEILVGPQMSA